MSRQSLRDFMDECTATAVLSTDRVVAAMAPLLRQVIETHEAGRVAPLEGIDHVQVERGHLWFEDRHRRWPRQSPRQLHEVEGWFRGHLDIVAEVREDHVDGELQMADLRVARPGDEITKPVYLPGYRSWEHHIGHHDELTDVYVLGLILAGLACGLDFESRQDLELLVASRSNLMAMAPSLHPVIAQTIVRMTELNRHRRAQNLSALLRGLEHYRDIDVDPEFDVSSIAGFQQQDRSGRRRAVLSRLEERLFEVSRRNPLLYFKPRANTLNMTYASVPLSFDPELIQPDSLFIWHQGLKEKIVAGEPLVLNKHLRFDETTYLPSTLDKIRLEAGRDTKEVGFSNLRLVIAFFRWHNIKEAPETKINSPLVLLPVGLKKQRGVRDRFVLQPLGSDAEVNPVLRHQLFQLYGIRLPESLDLATTDLDDLYGFLEDQIRASEPSVTLKMIDRPRVTLIHSQARRRLNHFLRRQRRYGRTRSYLDLDYSYRRDHFQPLGLRLFQSRIMSSEIYLDWVYGGRPSKAPAGKQQGASSREADPSKAGGGKDATSTDQMAVSFKTEGDTHPYAWEVDLCALTLGNFRYRKMSLVRDYEAVITEDRGNPVFDGMFSVDPRPTQTPSPALPLAERFPVLACDPTQASAIGQARSGQSYIIQGPPGTGKSQTIANLIADFVARGQRVLFVCEKRAAIDVVFLRLKALGLAELCCLVHDAQTDKKAVIHELRSTYRAFLEDNKDDGTQMSKASRETCLADLQRHLQPLKKFDQTMRSTTATGVPTWTVLSRLVTLRGELPDLEPLDKEALRFYDGWSEHREVLERLADNITELTPDGVFASHPLARLNPRLGAEGRPHQVVDQGLREVATLVARLHKFLRALPVDSEVWSSFAQIRELVAYAQQVESFAKRKILGVSELSSDASQTLNVEQQAFRRQQLSYQNLQQTNSPWISKLSRNDVENALELTKGLQGRWLPALRPSWWRLRAVLKRSYDWSVHQLPPSWQGILTHLQDEYQAADTLAELDTELSGTYGWDDFPSFCSAVEVYREASRSWDGVARALHDGVLAAPDAEPAQRALVELSNLEEDVDAIEGALGTFLADPLAVDVRRLDDVLQEIERHGHRLDEILPCFVELMKLPTPIARAIRERPWTLPQLEAAVAESSLDSVYRADRSIAGFSARSRDQHLDQLHRCVDAFHQANAVYVKERVRGAFQRRAALSNVSSESLTTDEKMLKERYSRGRRELEHEFGKKMRYKSIRDLWTGPAGEVLRDFKPVWLMSPLSISDTLPLTDEHFDVVIFDEASQVPVEEAVPTLFRARQVIVVGDEMQLPPTSFFAARSSDDELLLVEDQGDVVEYDLSANSFLSQTAKRLPSTYLGWHYRSRSEALISFSNAAFYGRRLLTVPEEELPRQCEEIVVSDPEADAEVGVRELLDRSLSFHFLDQGIYEQRRNTKEANYIAHLVRGLLRQEDRRSVGVVAFSEAQQNEIELALERLARRDAQFGNLLEAEYEREEEGEQVGLLVKNLENIQGDERDIVILSVCYGPAPDGRMRMSFGPINQGGGEKRLNVAFSRSKHHMVVVSSIRYSAITNVYNDGARSLRTYLRYAESVSTGDVKTVESVLAELSSGSDRERRDDSAHPVIDELTTELASRGFLVERQVGQSIFRCDLAVYRPGDRIYRLGVLVDTEEHYRQSDVLERDLLKPRLLEDFGWRVMSVLTKDWYDDRDRVLQSLLQTLEHAGTEGDSVEIS